MSTYRYNENGDVVRDDGTILSRDALHPDRAAFALWLSDGNAVDSSPEPTIAHRRANVWLLIKAERTRREGGGVQAGGHWFKSDADSRIKFMHLNSKVASILAAGGTADTVLTVAGQPLQWKTEANVMVPMTVGLLQDICTAMEILDASAFARGEVLRFQVEASDAPESIVIASGWPEILEV